MKETQDNLKKIEVEGVSGGDAVKIIMNGEGELKKITFTAFPPDMPSTSIFLRAS